MTSYKGTTMQFLFVSGSAKHAVFDLKTQKYDLVTCLFSACP